MDKKYYKKDEKKLSSEALAELIVDELVMAGLIKKDDFNEAVKIATLEINIRKHAGDY